VEDERRLGKAGRLAADLGYLPIALEHAAAYLAETSQSPDDYLTQFRQNAHQLLSEPLPDFPASVSATWTLSTALLTPDAEHLFNLCAFFSPEPIAAELFLQNAHAVTDPPGLGEFLSSSQRFRAAASQLHRLSLVKVDGAHDLIHMHRVVQAVTRGQLRQNRPSMFRAYRAAVDALLAQSNPGSPDRSINDPIYDLSLQHLESERNFLNTSNARLRRLIIDQVRRLHLRGGHVEAMRFGQDALQVWRERLGADDIQVLMMAVEVAIAMRLAGRAAEARRLAQEALPLLRSRYGEEHEVTLLCANAYGADLRAQAQFAEALELDLGLVPRFERVFGRDHERTLNASDLAASGELAEAIRIGPDTLAKCRSTLGPNHPDTLIAAVNLAIDNDAAGSRGRADQLLADALRRYQETLTAEHPEARAAAQRIRLTAEIEPY